MKRQRGFRGNITTPHLYAVKNDVLLTVARGATTKELIAIAESLRPYRPD